MAKSKSELAKKLGSSLNQAVEAHKDDQTTYGFIVLPHGIKNGIARLEKFYFDTYKKGELEGEFYLRGVGSIVEPKTFTDDKGNEIDLRGAQTSIMLPCCAQKFQGGKERTLEQNMADVLMHMRRLGGEDYTSDASGDNLEELAEALQEAHPYFRFSTVPKIANKDGDGVKKGDITGVWENWNGTKGLEDYEPEEEEAFEDKTTSTKKPATPSKKPKVQEEEEEETKPVVKTKTLGGGKKPPVSTKPKVKQEEPEEGQVFDDGALDLDELVSQADNQDVDAGKRLVAEAVKAGYSEDAAKKANTWEEVADMIRNPKKSVKKPVGTVPTPKKEEDNVPTPKPGEEYLYTVETRNPKTKAIEREEIKCEVLHVFKKSKTVTLKNLEDHETEYEDVSWDELSEITEE